MADTSRFYLICYDTPSNRRRRKMHRMLKNYAVAVQKSVFETFLDGPRYDEMVNRMRKIVDESIDSIRMYGLSRATWRRVIVMGVPGRLQDPDHFVITDLNPASSHVVEEEEWDLLGWL